MLADVLFTFLGKPMNKYDGGTDPNALEQWQIARWIVQLEFHANE